jgi:hypothetical protein
MRVYARGFLCRVLRGPGYGQLVAVSSARKILIRNRPWGVRLFAQHDGRLPNETRQRISAVLALCLIRFGARFVLYKTADVLDRGQDDPAHS